MKRRANLLLSVLFVFLLGATWLLVFRLSKLTPEDEVKWQALLAATQLQKTDPLGIGEIKQNRSGSIKEIYLNGEGIRYIRIDCDHTTLALSAQNKTFGAEEFFIEPTALVQDRCDEKSQSIRLIQAKKASIDYQIKQLHAEEATLHSYHFPGCIPPKQISGLPYMTAKAKRLWIDFDEMGSLLSCSHLHLALTSEKGAERYIKAPKMTYFPKEDKMSFDSDERELVYFYDPQEQTILTAHQIEGYSLFDSEKQHWKATKGVHLVIDPERVKEMLGDIIASP